MTNGQRPWRDITDPRRATTVDDLDAGLKAPEFENLEIPERLGPVTITVDDHKFKRFAFTQDDDAPWTTLRADDGTPTAAAGLLVNDLVQLFTLRYAGSSVIGLHTEEQLWFDAPLRLGETVTLDGTYTEAYERRGQEYVVMEASAVAADGRTVVRHRGVEILKTHPGAVAGRGSTGAAPDPDADPRVTGEVSDDARRIIVAPDDLAVGDVLAPLEKTITFEQAAVYSRLGEYVTNLHNGLATARVAGLRVPIVQGAQQTCVVAELLTRTFGPRYLSGGWLRMKFLAPVDVFTPISVSGRVLAVETADDGSRSARLEVWIRRADGRLSGVGWASSPIAANSASVTNQKEEIHA
jgi:acyl dehydratase